MNNSDRIDLARDLLLKAYRILPPIKGSSRIAGLILDVVVNLDQLEVPHES